ncbi:MAG: DUF99 family protein [Thermoplasmata archaeon]|nr:DUF99 family protein [Thermoplasmata archaeon]RLF73588.1 MAG: hypothetical protein DRN55_03050 [Thermoplasmata archaeon]RLF75525.1 MAG: hypothetical protein DRN42_02715 [Thermoplasmata archaeon]HDD60640.1 DUF99 family protein [Euryarchaeota archaeon]
MKDIRFLGVDDSIVDFSSPYTDIVGVVMRSGGYIEGVLWDRVTVDGDDSTEVISSMILKSRFRDQIGVVLLDGFAVGGFNVVDIEELHRKVSVPVITVSLKKPSPGEMERALKGRIPGWERKLELMKERRVERVDVGEGVLYISMAGIERERAVEMLKASIVRGRTPEPLRVAHLMASALGKGESTPR